MKPLTGADMRRALDHAEGEAKRTGRPMQIVRNSLWDQLWNEPWRVVEKAARGQEVIVRDVIPAQEKTA